jgi:hypothetical protein
LGTERTTYAGGAQGEQNRRWSISSATAAEWKAQQTTLWKIVGKATGWKAGRCRHVQMSKLFSTEICNQAVMDCLAATDVGKFPPRQGEERRQEEHWQ